MKRNQLTAHRVAETTVTRGTADSLVGDAFARQDTVVIAASKVPSFNPAKALRNAVNEYQGRGGPVLVHRPDGAVGTERAGI